MDCGAISGVFFCCWGELFEGVVYSFRRLFMANISIPTINNTKKGFIMDSLPYFCSSFTCDVSVSFIICLCPLPGILSVKNGQRYFDTYS